jgi:hypothetical protein
MLGMKSVAERMAGHLVGHHPAMPGSGKTLQSVDATRRLEDRLHALHHDNRPESLQDDSPGDCRWHPTIFKHRRSRLMHPLRKIRDRRQARNRYIEAGRILTSTRQLPAFAFLKEQTASSLGSLAGSSAQIWP